MREEFDAIVIGAGVAGLSVAALLTSMKKKVLVLEKMKQVGGRATTFTSVIDGEKWRSDISGFHALVNGDHGALGVVYRESLGVDKLSSLLTAPQQGMTVFRDGKWQTPRELTGGANRDDFKKIINEIVRMNYENIGNSTRSPLGSGSGRGQAEESFVTTSGC